MKSNREMSQVGLPVFDGQGVKNSQKLVRLLSEWVLYSSVDPINQKVVIFYSLTL